MPATPPKNTCMLCPHTSPCDYFKVLKVKINSTQQLIYCVKAALFIFALTMGQIYVKCATHSCKLQARFSETSILPQIVSNYEKSFMYENVDREKYRKQGSKHWTCICHLVSEPQGAKSSMTAGLKQK